MAVKKEFKLISVLMGLAIFLISLAFMTITKTFAIENNDTTFRLFDIEIKDVETKNMNREDIDIRDTSVLFNVRLGKDNNTNSFYLKYVNNGNIDSKITSLEKQLLNKIYLFDYENKAYYLSDFAYFTVKNAENNKNNGIEYNSDLSTHDILNKKSENLVEVKVRLKYDSELNIDEKEALNYFLENNTIETSLYINVLYGEK